MGRDPVVYKLTLETDLFPGNSNTKNSAALKLADLYSKNSSIYDISNLRRTKGLRPSVIKKVDELLIDAIKSRGEKVHLSSIMEIMDDPLTPEIHKAIEDALLVGIGKCPEEGFSKVIYELIEKKNLSDPVILKCTDTLVELRDFINIARIFSRDNLSKNVRDKLEEPAIIALILDMSSLTDSFSVCCFLSNLSTLRSMNIPAGLIKKTEVATEVGLQKLFHLQITEFDVTNNFETLVLTKDTNLNWLKLFESLVNKYYEDAIKSKVDPLYPEKRKFAIFLIRKIQERLNKCKPAKNGIKKPVVVPRSRNYRIAQFT